MIRKKTALVIAALLIMASMGIYFYYGFILKGARNIESEIPDYSIPATKLLDDYKLNPEKADSLYLNKTIEIMGRITKKTDSVMILENNVFCLFLGKTKEKTKNNKIIVKGKCIGYDELFQEVKLDQCIIK